MMKSLCWKLCPLAAFGWLMLCGGTTPVLAADEGSAGTDDRLQRLEQRINQLAERQEQMMRRLSAAQEPQMRSPFNLPGERPGPMPSPGENIGSRLASAEMPAQAVARAHQGLHGLVGLMVLAGILCNILLAVWIFTDIRKHGEGSGIFIALALVAGIPSAIIYALVRIGDKREAKA
jgi:hypothetical protein